MSGQPKSLASRLKAWRRANGWHQWKAAEILGANLHTYRNWENARNEPQGIARHAIEEKINAPPPSQ